MAPALFPQVLAQQLPGQRIEKTNMGCIPLHSNTPADPTRRRAIVCGFDLDTSVQMHGSFAVLVIAEWLDRQREQCGALFGEHRRDLPFGGAVNSGIGPALFPAVQVSLRVVQTLEAEAFQRRFLGMGNARFDLTFSVRVSHTTG